MVAALVPPGSIAADIGSDHAYLPVYLVHQGVCPRVIASDVAAGPLCNAADTVRRAALQDKIELRLSDGFSRFAATDADCWVMTGMGGTLMTRLLDAAPWPFAVEGTVIVAQAMRRAHELRAWLVMNKFCIENEYSCYDADRAYSALRAVCNGVVQKYPPGYAHYGELIRCDAPAARDILAREQRYLHTRVDALKKAAPDCEELTRLEEVLHDFSAQNL